MAVVFQRVLYFKTGYTGMIYKVAQLEEETIGYCIEKSCRHVSGLSSNPLFWGD